MRHPIIENQEQSDRLVDAVMSALEPVSAYFNATVHGIESLPLSRSAFLIGNHSLLGIDAVVLFRELYEKIARLTYGLAHRSLFEMPGLERYLNRLGVVKGCRGQAVQLLEDGRMVASYPGGLRESTKGRDERYTLKWGGRRGFAHVALKSQAPVYPVAAIGPDDAFLFESYERRMPMPFFPESNCQAPFFIPFPRPISFEFYIGNRIEPPEVPEGASKARRDELAAQFAKRVQNRLQAMLSEHRPPMDTVESFAGQVMDFIGTRLPFDGD